MTVTVKVFRASHLVAESHGHCTTLKQALVEAYDAALIHIESSEDLARKWTHIEVKVKQ